ncbi:hypothetical protein M430DRAFT_36167 [Amorphotheca resinae ATCC 22711]|uniref:Hydrophobin n=1 Tax=Amorphotheca resinae ATCC 22711 TaxID=857342 RepID=A0A2T3AWA0_AMORE|nr:hypothetical protein M430DRAFT_36167 [Amorphotheca resinae ATCC 22711]PSS12957.1 hypothetical protein M430DRAFT_36167 [Amorphotheca resinae ATCC 22711]
MLFTFFAIIIVISEDCSFPTTPVRLTQRLHIGCCRPSIPAPSDYSPEPRNGADQVDQPNCCPRAELISLKGAHN